ncbi:hypothetical protein VDGD_21446 [Verticillium dahliae]|nr:hypothetical protein VDGD_21446 [Verticillium dahliae]
MDDFQALSDRYLQWFKAAGGEFRDDLLQIVDLRPQAAGRGISETPLAHPRLLNMFILT